MLCSCGQELSTGLQVGFPILAKPIVTAFCLIHDQVLIYSGLILGLGIEGSQAGNKNDQHDSTAVLRQNAVIHWSCRTAVG